MYVMCPQISHKLKSLSVSIQKRDDGMGQRKPVKNMAAVRNMNVPSRAHSSYANSNVFQSHSRNENIHRYTRSPQRLYLDLWGSI